ncbi:MAG TPA: FtsX-like permease family protein, partial [Solirubrobacterales bacterium]|nr:FtsX-like permease family protein [Solirubrobacterales bacterium]
VSLFSPRLVRPLASVTGRPLERLRGLTGRLARENAMRKPGRTAATAAALMIGLALVSFVTVFAAGLKGSIDDAIDEGITADLLLSNTDNFSDIPALAAEEVRDVPGVESSSPYRYTQAQVEGADGTSYLSLIDPATVNDIFDFEWREGSAETASDLGPSDAFVDEGWAEDNDIGVGDSFAVTTPSGKEVEYAVTGTFEDNTDFFGDYVASGQDAAAYGEADNVTNVFITLADDADGDAVRSEIEGVVDTAFPTAKVQNREELKDAIGSQLNQLLGVVYALLGLAVIVSLFGIVNTLALSIYERTRELGLLRAVGMSRRQVRRIIRYEAVITALIGAVLGLILGILFAILVSRPLADEGFVLKFPVATLLVLLVLAAIAGVLAAIAPARRASRLDVLRALAYE